MMNMKRNFILCWIITLPLTLCGQAIKPVTEALIKQGESASLQEVTSQIVQKAVMRAGRGVLTPEALRMEIFRAELAQSSVPIQMLGQDWKAIGRMLETPEGLNAVQSQTGQSGPFLVQDIVNLSEVHLLNCRHDLSKRLGILSEQQKQGELLATPQSQQDFIQAVNDIVGMGLFGGVKESETLYDAYKKTSGSPLGNLLLVPVTRSMMMMGRADKAKALVQEAPASPARDQMLAFLEKGPRTHTEDFNIDASLEPLGPVLQVLPAKQKAVFDFSPNATSFWVETSGNIRAGIQQAKLASNPALAQTEKKPVQPAAQTSAATEPVSREAVKIEPIEAHIIAPEIRLQTMTGLEGQPVAPAAKPAGTAPASGGVSGRVSAVFPSAIPYPKRTKFPSGLTNEHELIVRWASDYGNGYFKPRNQIETIEGMSAAKANNIVEYLYYMDLEEGKKVIIQPILENGRLPEFMYDNKLIPNTRRLPAMYYKNKFNDNVKRLVKLADKPGSLYADYAELKDLFISMKDYTFKQGFGFTNSDELANALRKKWDTMVEEVTSKSTPADPSVINRLWREKVTLSDGKEVSLRDYFTQTRATAFFPEGAMPEFYLNSPKWVSWENVRRDLIAAEILPPEPDLLINKIKKALAGVDDKNYMTLEQFGKLMIEPYLKVYRDLREFDLREGAVSDSQSSSVIGEENVECVDEQIRQNNFDVVGGVCMSSFGDGGFMGNRDPNYDGTSLRNRYEPVVFDQVKVVVFNDVTLKPEIKVLDKVSYLKDLKKPDLYKEKASRMVGDGLDETRDLLSVQRASEAVLKIPSLRATIRPHSRISYAQDVPYMVGGGLSGYLALFTPDFYPIKEVKLLREVNGKKEWVTEYFIRREVVALSGFIHRERLAFSSQANLREQAGPNFSGSKSDIKFGSEK